MTFQDTIAEKSKIQKVDLNVSLYHLLFKIYKLELIITIAETILTKRSIIELNIELIPL